MIERCMEWLPLAQVAEGAAKSRESLIPGWGILLIILVIFVVPFLLGNFLGRALRLKEFSQRISVVIMSLFVGLAPFVYQYIKGPLEQRRFEREFARWEETGKEKGEPAPQKPEPRTWLTAIKLGIDLAGGTNLVYQVLEPSDSEKKIDNDVMNQMVAAIARRVNPSGAEEITVRRVGVSQIEVIIPKADPELVRQKKAQIVRLGNLEFALLANRRQHADIIERALRSQDRDLRRDDELKSLEAGWRPAAIDRVTKQPKQVGSEDAITRPGRTPGSVEFLCIFGLPEERVTGKYLVRAQSQPDPQSLSPAVSFTFSTQGGAIFSALTSANRPMADGFRTRLAILLDEEVHSAPGIKDVINTQGQITGNFTTEEVDELVGVLKSGALVLPIKREPVSEQTISPTLGADVQTKGIRAVLFSAVAVFVFMLVYYRRAGVVADICLAMNIVLLFAAMAIIEAAFTLPGLAGVVLTIGMAVDSNVLIYERMREELHRGSSMRMAVQNGFARAFSAILDSNVTTLLTAVILYIIGTDQIRGFAVTLFIGLVVSLFTVLYVGRLIFEIGERKRWLGKLKMNQFVGETHFDYIAKRRLWIGISAVIIAIGLGALAMRGKANLDIDFTGGTMATFEFENKQSTETVKQILSQYKEPNQESPALGTNVSVEEITLAGDAESEVGKRFRLRTSVPEVDVVRQSISRAFDKPETTLRKVTVDYDPASIKPTADAQGKNKEGLDVTPEFNRGQQVELTFSSEIEEGAIQTYLTNQITEIKVGEQQKYERPEETFRVIGLEGSGTESLPGAVRKFKKVRVESANLLEANEFRDALASMKKYMQENPYIPELNTFDSSVADNMRNSAFLALFLSLVAIIGYIWFRFDRVEWGIAATSALVHDVLVAIGAIALASYASQNPIGQALGFSDFKIDLAMVAAFLTIVGYSLNDTIVIFDRIREIRGKDPHFNAGLVNLALNQTLSRTILTALTVLIVVLILYAFGGEGIHGFAFCMVIGTLAGSYSTIFIASPVLVWLMKRSGAPT